MKSVFHMVQIRSSQHKKKEKKILRNLILMLFLVPNKNRKQVCLTATDPGVERGFATLFSQCYSTL